MMQDTNYNVIPNQFMQNVVNEVSKQNVTIIWFFKMNLNISKHVVSRASGLTNNLKTPTTL